jgi:peroxiredoxin family protein
VNTLKKGGPGKAQFSKFNFMGLGKYMLQRVMKKKGVEDIEALYEDVKELGAHIHLCETTAELFGVGCKEINAGDNVDQCGVTTFLSRALNSKLVLFV